MTASPGELFDRFAKRASNATGRPATFAGATIIIVVWALAGPAFGFNDTWQLAINTGTTIVTFLMVFLIQNSQNRATTALQIKLDKLIYVIAEADDRLLDLEELDDRTLTERRRRFEDIAKAARRELPDGPPRRPTPRPAAATDPTTGPDEEKTADGADQNGAHRAPPAR